MVQNQFQKMFAEVAENERFKNQTEKAKKVFSPKPFAVEYAGIRQTVSILLPFFSIMSIGLATGYLLTRFSIVVPSGFAFFFAVALLVGLELLKWQTLKMTFKNLFAGVKIFGFPLMMFAFGLTALSVFLSVFGAVDTYKMLDSRKTDFQAVHGAKIDSVGKYYDTEIKAAQRAKNEFLQSVSYKGKVNIYNDATASTIANFDKQINALQTEKSKRLQALNDDGTGTASALDTGAKENMMFFLCFSALNEFMIIACNFFLMFYVFKTYKESEFATMPERVYDVSLQDLQVFGRLMQANQNSTLQVLAEHEQKKVGFQLPKKQEPPTLDSSIEFSLPNQEKTRKSSIEAEGQKDNTCFQDLIQDLKNGVHDTRFLAKKHRVNVGQIAEAKKQLGIKPKRTKKT